MNERRPESGLSAARLVAVALLGCLLFTSPFLWLFNRSTRVFGLPILFVYLFTAWAVVIGLVAVLAGRPNRPLD